MERRGEAEVVEYGGPATAATSPEPGAGPGPVRGEDPSPSGAEEFVPPAMSRRIRLARMFCLLSMGVFPLLIPFMGGTGLLADLGLATVLLADQPGYVLVLAGVRSLVMFVASILCALSVFRMIRERLDGRQVPERRTYRYTASLFLVLCLFLWYTPNVFFLCATVWTLAYFLTPREQLLRLSLALGALPWANALLSPVHTPLLPVGNDHGFLTHPSGLLVHSLTAVLWAVVLWLGCLYTVWLWDGIRKAVDGQRARAQLAVDGERLRFTNDMRDLLGHRLDALKLAAQRAAGLLRSDSEGARAEIDQVHELARATLRQVRSAVRGYRDVDLGAEVGSVRAVLAANGTTTTVTGLADLNLPTATAALAAWVVREGGTNVLRHSRAQSCRLSFTVVDDPADRHRELVVEMANDRVRDGERDGVDSVSGLVGLADRISGGGGRLAAARTNDGGFLLRAVLPLSDGPIPPGPSVDDGLTPVAVTGQPGGGAASARDTPVAGPSPAGTVIEEPAQGLSVDLNDHRVRAARRIIAGMIGFNGLILVMLALADLFFSSELNLPLWRSGVGTTLAAVVAALLFLLLRERLDGNRQPSPRLLWVSVALLLLCAAFLNTPPLALVLIGSWWGTGILFVSRRNGGLVSLVLLLAPLPLLPTFASFLEPAGLNPLAYGLLWLFAVAFALFSFLCTFGTIWLWDISREAVAGQRARAQLAVTQERLRFARDMHDLLGHSLSALAVKAQLAGRLVDRAPERAATEIAEVQVLARQALQQVRSAVSGYRAVDLEGEVDAVTSVLDAGGTRTVVTGLEGLELPSRVAGLAAWVVREGGTNVLRHSDAAECQISFTLTKEGADRLRQLVVEVHNDAAREVEAGRSDGNGLAGLSERVAMGGGTLSSARTRDGGFLLRAVIPL